MKSIVLVLAIFVLAGCKYNPSSSPTGTTKPGPSVGSGPGTFGFKLNGDSVMRGSDRTKNYAWVNLGLLPSPPYPSGARTMGLELNSVFTNGGNSHTISVSFSTNYAPADTMTYPLPDGSNNTALASAFIQIDSFIFSCHSGGTLVVTKFDTSGNTVSGHFSFIASETSPVIDPSNKDTISGYFTNIQINSNGWGLGSISADINGAPFDSRMPYYTLAGALYSDNILRFECYAPSTEINRDLSIVLPYPKVGDYVLGPNPDQSTATLSYFTRLNSKNAYIYSGPNAKSSLTITRCDTVAHRIWGKFSLVDGVQGGDTIRILNGRFDSLWWALR